MPAAVRVHRVVRPGRRNAPGALDRHRRRMPIASTATGSILVRPDGYVGYTGAGRRRAGLGRYLARFFG